MSRARRFILPSAAALFVACALTGAPVKAAVNPNVMKEVLTLLVELGYVPSTSATSVDHNTDTALTLFFKSENPSELAGIQFGPGVWENNLDKCLEALRNAAQRAHDDQTKPSVFIETPHEDYNVHVASDLAGKSVISLDASTIKSWDPKAGRQRWSLVVPAVMANRNSSGSITVTDDGRYAVIGSIAFRVYEIATGKVIRTFWDRPNRFNTLYPVAAIAARPGTSELIVAEGVALEKLVVFDWKTGHFLAEIGHENSISLNLALSPDGRYAATTSYDAGIRIWDLAHRRLLRTLTLPGGLKFQNPVFFGDGRTLAVFGTYALNGKDRSTTLSIFDIERGHIASREFSYVDYSHYSAAVGENSIYVTGSDTKGERRATLVLDTQARTVRKLPNLESHDLIVGTPPVAFGMEKGRLAAYTLDGKNLWPNGNELIGFDGFLRDADNSSDSVHGIGKDVFKLDLSSGTIEPTGRFQSEEHSYSKLTGLRRASDGRLAGGFFDAGTGQVQDADGKVICKIEAKTKTPDDIVVINTFDHSKAMGLIALWVDSSVALFDDKTCQEQRRILVEFAGRARAISIMGVQPFPAGFRFSGDGETLYVWRADTAVQAFDPRTGRRLAIYHTDFDNGSTSSDLVAAFRSASSAGLSPLVHKVLPVPNSKRFMAVITANAYTRNGYKGGLVLVFEEGNPRWIRAYRFPQNLDKWAIDPSGTRLVADLLEFGVQIVDFATGHPIAGFGSQPANIHDIAFSPDSRHVLILSGDGVLRIFSATTGALLITSTAMSDGSWLASTPEGFFAGSPGGGRLVRIRRGDTAFDVDQFYQALYRPDLVREKLAGDPRGLVREAAAQLDLTKVVASGNAPAVRVVSPAAGTSATSAQIMAEVEIEARGGGVGRIEWRVNGLTVGVETSASQPPVGQPIRLTHNLALDAGDNIIEVVAYNSANLIASTVARANVTAQAPTLAPGSNPSPGAVTSPAPASTPATPAPAPVAAKPRLFVLAAGVNDYADKRFRLNLAVQDAKDMGQAFIDAGKGLYQNVEIKLLTDTDVTRDKLDAAFSELAGKVLPTDVFVLYLAGHGKTVDGRYYFVPQNFKVDGDPTNATIDTAVTSQGIAQTQLQKWLALVPAKKSLVLLDTCESGTVTGVDSETKALERGAASDRLAEATGRSIITASSGDTEAIEGYRGHGLFTYNLLDALDRGDGDGNGTIEVNELAAYVYVQVAEISEQVFKQRQAPQMKITSNYALTRQARVLRDNAPAVAMDNKPKYQVMQTAQLQIKPSYGATVVRSLSAKTAVTVLKSEGGWSLIASEGRPIGYVATRDLAPMQ